MSKLIDAEKLTTVLRGITVSGADGILDFNDAVDYVCDMLESAPEDVVRCSNCKFWDIYDLPIMRCKKGLRLPVDGHEYCSRGEKIFENDKRLVGESE